MRYHNYHKHDYYGNFVSLDTITSMEDYFKRAKELGHDTFFTVNHGFQGNIFEAKTLAEKYEMKVVMGAEGYYVPDNKEKDKSNRHIIIIALNDNGARQLNEIMSEAFINGFYYKPRIDEKLLFSLNPNNFVITTACVAGIWSDENLVLRLKEHFKDNFFLEVQNHNQEIQKNANKEILRMHYKYNIPIIHANDSHYIYATNNDNAEEVVVNGKKYKLLEANRDLFLKAKGIIYEEETSFILDYPDYDTIVERYKIQGILTDVEIKEALENTLVFDKAENLGLVNYDIKLPSISDNPEKELKSIIKKSWDEVKHSIPRERWKEYIDAIKYEVDIITKTKMENYFILDHKIVEKAQKDYNGKLTHTGRGSAPSFYITKLLGLTDIDRLNTPITLFPTRFMSIERIIGAKSLPDIDLNTANAKPFIQATEDLLGKENCAWMIAWKPLQKASAFRLYCKAIGMEMEEYNDVAKDISAQAKIKKESKYEEDDVWGPIIKASAPFVGVVESIADSPCFTKGHLVYTDKGYKKIENINIGDNVLTHRNRFKKVKNIMQKQTDELLELKIYGSPIIECTKEHPFYVKELIGRKYFKKSNQEKYSSVRKFTNPFWKKAIDLNKKDYIGMAINQKQVAYKNEENYNLPFDNNNFWWIIGRYLGDGWIKKNKRTDNKDKFLWHFYICTSKEKKEQTELEEKLFGLFNYTKTDNGTTMKYDIFSKELSLFVEQFGKHSYEKYIPQNIIDLPKDNLKSLIEGYISADGYKPNGRNTIILTTVSPKMAFSFQQCVHKVYNVPASVSLYKKETLKSSFYEGREIKHQNDVYRISYNLDGSRYKGFYDKEYMWFPVREINLINKTECTVYNLEVEDDESYTIFNNIVHNCSMLVYDKPVNREIGLIRTREGICCLLDGYNCDKYKYLKNDYLTVQVWAIIKETCDLVGIPVPSIDELNKLLDKETYDIYAKGLTCTINQADSDFATPLVKRYKPKSPSEMSAFVAIIRPGCKSLLEDFLNRKPYTTGVKELDAILEDSGHRMIYQESIMKYLIWLGISEPHSYDIIKKIAKKKFKEQELKELKKQLIDGWKKQVGTEEGFEETWQVVEDASKYSFNASHSLSYAYDSLYGAYLKSHYPLEYYTVVLNNYKDDEDRTNKLIKELPYFGISLLSPQFGKSKDVYFMNKETNSIYKGIASLKYLNQDVSIQLYNLSQENKYDYFTDLLYDIWRKTSLDQRQLEILIKCDYFSQFGDVPLLLGIAKEFKNGKNRIYNTLKEETILKRKEAIRELEINKEIKDEISKIDILRFKMQNGIDFQSQDKSHSNKEFIIADINFMGKSKKAKAKIYQLSTGRLLEVKFNNIISDGKSVGKYDYIIINNIKSENKWYKDDTETDPNKQWKRYKEEDNQKEFVVYSFSILDKYKE